MIDLEKIKSDYIKSLSKGWDKQTKEDFDLFLENEAESFIKGFKEGWNMAVDQCAETAKVTEEGYYNQNDDEDSRYVVDENSILQNKI